MSGACPSCGVTVIPGYVKCPRCHAVLPGAPRGRRSSLAPGGTAIERRGFPIVPTLAGALALGVVLLLVLEGGGRKHAPLEAAAAGGPTPAGGAAAAAAPGSAPANAAPAPAAGPAGAAPPGGAIPGAGPAPAPAGAAAPGAAVPAPAPQPALPRPLDIPAATESPASVAAELERALGHQRLWSSVAATGDRVEVRSGSCADPAMGPMIDAARAALRGVGLTRLRCLAQSGAVVFERDL